MIFQGHLKPLRCGPLRSPLAPNNFSWVLSPCSAAKEVDALWNLNTTPGWKGLLVWWFILLNKNNKTFGWTASLPQSSWTWAMWFQNTLGWYSSLNSILCTFGCQSSARWSCDHTPCPGPAKSSLMLWLPVLLVFAGSGIGEGGMPSPVVANLS